MSCAADDPVLKACVKQYTLNQVKTGKMLEQGSEMFNNTLWSVSISGEYTSTLLSKCGNLLTKHDCAQINLKVLQLAEGSCGSKRPTNHSNLPRAKFQDFLHVTIVSNTSTRMAIVWSVDVKLLPGWGGAG